MARTRQAPPAKSAATKRRPATTPSRGAAPAGGKKTLGLQRWQLILAAVVVGAVLIYLYVKNKNAASTTAATTQTPDSATGQGYWDSSGAASGSPTTAGQTDANANPADSSVLDSGQIINQQASISKPGPDGGSAIVYPGTLVTASGVNEGTSGQSAVGGTPGGQGSGFTPPATSGATSAASYATAGHGL